MSNTAILEVKNLTKHFKAGRGQVVHAVDNVSFTLEKGKTLGLVGESGCGKSSCARTIIRIYDPTGGQILLDGQDITHMKQRELKPIRRKMQMIFHSCLLPIIWETANMNIIHCCLKSVQAA